MSGAPAFDVQAVRRHFPSLRNGAAHFDGPGGSQTPDVVAEAIAGTLTGPLAYRGFVTQAERNAEAAVTGARGALADLLNADAGGVIFGRSMTQLTFDLARTIAKDWHPGDEVIVTRLDHEANVRPWVVAAEAAGAVVRWADFDPETGELAAQRVGELLSARTKLVAVTAASNLIGTKPALRAISELVHQASAWFYVDGVHLTAHSPVDVMAFGADFYGCSPYKFLGPHCGAIAARPELLERLRPDKLPSAPDDVPERFELGTLPYELMAGTTAAIDFLAAIAPGDGSRRERLIRSMTAIELHEDALRACIEDELRALPRSTVHSRAASRTPTLLTSFGGHRASDIQRFLADRGVNAPAGTFYATAAARHLGLGDEGGLRIGLAPYNDQSDVDRLIAGLRAYFAS